MLEINYNKETSKEYIFYLVKKIYLELNTLDNKLNNYDEDIKWLHFKNIIMDARAIHKSILFLFPALWVGIVLGFLFIGLFSALVAWAEKKELQKMPVIGSYFN